MDLFLAKRFATFVATLFGTTVITVLTLEVLPGDPRHDRTRMLLDAVLPLPETGWR